MAFTAETQFSFTLLDQLGTEASVVIYALADPTKTLTNIAADWATWAGLLDLITGGQIIRGQVRLVQTPGGGLKGSPASGSRVEQTGVFDLTNASNMRLFGQPVPSISDGVIVGGQIDLTDTNVANFVTALHTATANSEPTSNQFLVLSALNDAFLSFRKRRKQLSRSSREL
jgi:hypothetical protein